MSVQQKQNWMYFYVIVASCLLTAGTMGLPNAYGVFYSPMAEQLQVGIGDVSLHMTISRILTGFAMPFLVILLRRRVNNRFIMGVGMLLILVSGIVIAISDRLTWINLISMIRGIGLATGNTMMITLLVGNWFVKHRGTVSGIALSFSGVGSAIASPILTRCMSLYGFRMTYIGHVIAMVVLMIPALLCPLRPSQIGMEAYGKVEAKKGKEEVESLNLPLKYQSLLYVVLLSLVLLSVSLTGINSHLPTFAKSYGYEATVGATLLSISMIGNVASNFY